VEVYKVHWVCSSKVIVWEINGGDEILSTWQWKCKNVSIVSIASIIMYNIVATQTQDFKTL